MDITPSHEKSTTIFIEVDFPFKWIKVQEKPPPKDISFLAFSNGEIISCEWCNDIDDFIPNCSCSGWEHDRSKMKFTWWMPLPKPPVEK